MKEVKDMESTLRQLITGRLLTPEAYAVIFLVGFIVGIVKAW